MNNPLVSIIIPTYNRAHLIGETLDSVLAQNYENWECIIVDDGSTDNTDDVVGSYIKKDARFQYHQRPETHKPGGNGARNYGFEISKGEYTNWFDSDDVMCENHLLLHLNNFSLHPEINLSCSTAVIFEKKSDNIVGDMLCKLTSSQNLIYDLILGNIFFLTPCSVWKLTDKSNNVSFNENIFRGQEADFNFRQAQVGIKHNYIEESTVMVRRGHDSISSQFKNDIKKRQSQFDYYTNIFTTLRCIDLQNDLFKFEQIKKYIVFRMLMIYADIRVTKNKIAYSNSLKNKKVIINCLPFLKVGIADRIRAYLGLQFMFFFKRGYTLLYIKNLNIKKWKN